VRRWGNQAIFLESLTELAEQFDLSDPSPQNRERIAAFLYEIKARREKKSRLTHGAIDIVTGVASILFAPAGLIGLAKATSSLLRSSQRNTNLAWAEDWDCIVSV